MSTPYDFLFDSFISKIEDPMYSNLTPDEVETDMIKLLNSAIINFDYPKVDIRDKDDTLKQFNLDVGLDEIEIIANLMKLEWIKRKINTVKVIEQAMSSKDFALTSQANHLKSMLELKKDTEEDIKNLLTRYSYKNNNRPNYDGLSGGD